MQIGMIGLGKMGMNMAKRLMQDDHEVVVYNRSQDKVKTMEEEGAEGCSSLDELISKLNTPKVVWVMLPAGKPTEEHITLLGDLLDKGDIIIDGGNSFYKDDVRREKDLAPKGIRYMDAGVSGGIWGLDKGYCIMTGGAKADHDHIEPLLKSLTSDDAYHYCGHVGAGHFVKMVHNGIEYAMMESYAEGFEILKASPYGEKMDYGDIAHLWNKGSVVRSWLLELLESVFDKDSNLDSIKGYVDDSGEGRWSVQQAVESGVDATAIAYSLFKRFNSRKEDSFSNKILAALRHEFGGHNLKAK